MFGPKTDPNQVVVLEGHTLPVLLVKRGNSFGIELSKRGLQMFFCCERIARMNFVKHTKLNDVSGSRPGTAKKKGKPSRRNSARLCTKQVKGSGNVRRAR